MTNFMTISPISAFSDNYIWLLTQGNNAWFVDPGESAPVETALQQQNLTLQGILITHHHWDHTGGVADLLAARSIPVWGPETCECVTHPVKEGDMVLVFNSTFKVIAVPGHTLDHLAYYSESEEALFCGDTLFSAGCGRLFEGTAKMMLQSLNKLAKLPKNTKVYCAHEYTLSNLKFALAVEPNNKAIKDRIKKVELLRSNQKPSLPSSIEIELETNPFLRSNTPSVQQAAQNINASLINQSEIFATIRSWKDNF